MADLELPTDLPAISLVSCCVHKIQLSRHNFKYILNKIIYLLSIQSKVLIQGNNQKSIRLRQIHKKLS